MKKQELIDLLFKKLEPYSKEHNLTKYGLGFPKKTLEMILKYLENPELKGKRPELLKSYFGHDKKLEYKKKICEYLNINLPAVVGSHAFYESLLNYSEMHFKK